MAADTTKRPGWPHLAGGFLILCGALWLLRGALLPFCVGIAGAYMLRPLVSSLERRGLNRTLSAAAVMLGALVFGGGFAALLVPLVAAQADAIAVVLPHDVETLRMAAESALARAEEWLPAGAAEQLKTSAGAAVGAAASSGAWLVKAAIDRSMALMDLLSVAVIGPVVAFHMLRDWDLAAKTVDANIPASKREAARSILAEIDATLSGFMRGQASVCLILMIFYSCAYALVGMRYALTLGVLTGALAFIPYVGSLMGGLLSMALAGLQFQALGPTLLVGAALLVGQPLESYVLVPKLIGGKINLHPVWVLFALMSGATLLGVLGVVAAVPTAAVMGVLLRRAAARWRADAA